MSIVYWRFRLSPKILLAFTIKPIFISGLAFKFSRTRQVKTFTGLGYTFVYDSFLSRVLRLGLSVSLSANDILIAQNSEDKQVLESFTGNRRAIGLIKGSGVTLKEFVCDTPKKVVHKRILWVGRLISQKGIQLLLDNFILVEDYLASNGLTLTLVVDIDQNNPDRLNEKILDGALQSKVFNVLYSPQSMAEIYQNHDILLNFSFREGLSRVILEAMAAGLGIYTNNNPGCHEMITKTSINNVSSNQTIPDLLKYLDNFYSLNSEEREIMSLLNSKNIINNYGSDSVGQSFHNLILKTKI